MCLGSRNWDFWRNRPWSSRVPDAVRHEMTQRRSGTHLDDQRRWTPDQQRTTSRRATCCAASARISRVSGQAISNARASCPYSKRLTPDETAFATAQIAADREFGAPGLVYSHGTFTDEAKDLARVKGNSRFGIEDLCPINFHTSLLDQSRDFTV